MKDYSNVKELKKCKTVDEVNQWISEGWTLLGIFNEESFVLGREFLSDSEYADICHFAEDLCKGKIK